MSRPLRLSFRLTELSESISHEKAANLGLDFNRYFDKVLYDAMKSMDSDIDLNKTASIIKLQIKRPVLKNRYDFIQRLALKHKTSMSNIVELLLVKGPNSLGGTS